MLLGQNVAGSNPVRVDITSGGSNQDAKIDFGYYTTLDVNSWNIGRWGVDGSFRISDFASGSETNRFLINTSGNVGIGTATPNSNAKLPVASGSPAKLQQHLIALLLPVQQPQPKIPSWVFPLGTSS